MKQFECEEIKRRTEAALSDYELSAIEAAEWYVDWRARRGLDRTMTAQEFDTGTPPS